VTPDASAAERESRPNLPGHAFVVAAFALCCVVFIAEHILGDNGFVSLLLYPVVAALIPLIIRTRRWPRIVAAVLIAPMATYIFSVGIFFAPAVILLLIAACATPRITWDAKYAEALADDRADDV